MKVLEKAQHYGLLWGFEHEHFGVEEEDIYQSLETVYPEGRWSGDDFYPNGNLGEEPWFLKSDCSVTDEGWELVTPPMQPTSRDIGNVCEVIHTIGGLEDESCGGHIHVSIPQWDVRTLTNVYKIANKMSDFLYKSREVYECRQESEGYAAHPRTYSRFLTALETCKPTSINGSSNSSIEYLWNWYGRRGGINLGSVFYRGTVEFRFFNGVGSSFDELRANIMLALGIVTRACELKQTSGRIKTLSGLPKDLRDWRVFLNQIGLDGRGLVPKNIRKELSRAF